MENKIYPYPMEVVCAWCKKHMSWATCHEPGKISHGICESCKIEVMAEIKSIRINPQMGGAC